LEIAVVGPAMPSVVREFGDAGLYPWAFAAYTAAQTATIPLYGAMADRSGRRSAYALGVGLFLLGSLLCAAAGSMEQVVAGRLVQGLGGAVSMPTASIGYEP
jgi:MFS family permease